MTVSTTINRAAFTGNGVTTAFPFPYKFFSQADLVVIETVIATGVQTTKALTTDYTISGSTDATGAYPNGGTVNAVTAPASTVTWTIVRDPAIKQLTEHVDNDPLPASSIDNPLDLITVIAQRLAERITRSLRQPDGDTADVATLPAKVSRASMLLGFDSNGDPQAISPAGVASTATIVSAFIATLLDDADAATARTTLGLKSSAIVDTGTSGTKVPLLDGANTWSALQTLNAGLGFPAVQVPSGGANTLDDYEEGTWTPSDASGATLTFTNTSGNCQYVKVGQLVMATFMVTYPSTVSGSAAVIGGLPFTSQNTTSSIAGALVSFTDFGSPITILASNNGTSLLVFDYSGNQKTNANMSTKTVRGVVLYRASA